MKTNNKQKRFNPFVKLLMAKASSIKVDLNEELLRYYYAISQCPVRENVLMEVPIAKHISASKKTLRKTNSRCKFDLYYEKPDMAVEFKYDRSTVDTQACYTQKAGSAFSDLNRLSLLDCKKKYFVYLFDKKMKDYYANRDFYVKDIFVIGGDVKKTFHSSSFPQTPNTFASAAFSGCNTTGAVTFTTLNYTAKRVLAIEIAKDELYLVIIQVITTSGRKTVKQKILDLFDPISSKIALTERQMAVKIYGAGAPIQNINRELRKMIDNDLTCFKKSGDSEQYYQRIENPIPKGCTYLHANCVGNNYEKVYEFIKKHPNCTTTTIKKKFTKAGLLNHLDMLQTQGRITNKGGKWIALIN